MLVAVASLATFTALFGVLAAVVTAAIGVREYALKARAQRAQTDIELAKLFSELLPIANARGPAHVSEAAVQAVLANNETVVYGDELARLVTLTGCGYAGGCDRFVEIPGDDVPVSVRGCEGGHPGS